MGESYHCKVLVRIHVGVWRLESYAKDGMETEGNGVNEFELFTPKIGEMIQFDLQFLFVKF